MLRAASSEVRRSRARGRAHAGGGRALRDPARRRRRRDRGLRIGAGDRSRRARRLAARALERLYEKQKRWADLARLLERRALQSAPPEATRCGGAAPRSWPTISRARRRGGGAGAAVRRQPRDRRPGLLDMLERIYARADGTTTTCARCSGRRTLSPTRSSGWRSCAGWPRRARRAPRGWTGRPRRWSRSCASSRATRRPSPRSRHLPRRGPAGGAGGRDVRGGCGHRDHRGAARAAVRARPDLRARAGRMGARARRLQPSRGGGRRAAGDLRAIDWLAERLGRWDVAAEATRKWTAIAPEDAAALAASARVRRHNGELEAALGLFLDAAERETTGTAQAALLTEAALILQGGPGQGEPARSKGSGGSGGRAVRPRAGGRPDHAPAAERLAEIYAPAAAGPTSRSCWTSSSTGWSPGETDRLVALEMKLAEACVQLGKTDKNKMDKALDSLARAHEARAESLPVLHKYGDLPCSGANGRTRRAVRIDPARPAPDAVALGGRGGGDADAPPATVELGNPDDAFAS